MLENTADKMADFYYGLLSKLWRSGNKMRPVGNLRAQSDCKTQFNGLDGGGKYYFRIWGVRPACLLLRKSKNTSARAAARTIWQLFQILFWGHNKHGAEKFTYL